MGERALVHQRGSFRSGFARCRLLDLIAPDFRIAWAAFMNGLMDWTRRIHWELKDSAKRLRGMEAGFLRAGRSGGAAGGP